MDALNDATAIIKTFERPECLSRLLASLRAFYPDLAVMVADDSCPAEDRRANAEACALHKAEYLPMPPDCGLSFGRNRLIERVKTPFFFLLDDDFVFTDRTRIDILLERLKRYELDVVAGAVEIAGEIKHYEGLLELKDGVLRYLEGNRGRMGDVVLYDLVFNFFAGRTEPVRWIGWDDQLKLAEHTDFFLRARGALKVGYCGQVMVTNSKTIPSPWYARMRKRGGEFFNVFVRKHSLLEVINFEGVSFRM